MRWKTRSTRTSKLVFYSKFCFFLKKHTPGTWKPCSNDLQSFVFRACLCLLPSKLQNFFLAARHASQSKLTPFRGDHRRKVCYLSFTSILSTKTFFRGCPAPETSNVKSLFVIFKVKETRKTQRSSFAPRSPKSARNYFNTAVWNNKNKNVFHQIRENEQKGNAHSSKNSNNLYQPQNNQEQSW